MALGTEGGAAPKNLPLMAPSQQEEHDIDRESKGDQSNQERAEYQLHCNWTAQRSDEKK